MLLNSELLKNSVIYLLTQHVNINVTDLSQPNF